MECELSVFAKQCQPSQAPAILTSAMFRDREELKPVQLRLLEDDVEIEQVQPYSPQDGVTYAIKLEFEVKFTLLREAVPIPDKTKLGEPYGLKFERNPSEGCVEFYCEKNKELLLEWRDRLARKINQRGFHQLIRPYRKIGKGNTATVYLAERLEDRKKIAVKAFAKEALTVELKGKESLMNEINVMRSLDHPCLMKLYEVFESDNSFYLVIEHLEGGQLFQKLNNRRFKLHEIQEILRNLIHGLVEMHQKRIIHRDLKPENLIFRTVGTNDIVIADYGLATWADAPDYIFVRCGTPGYVAPEIINCKARNGQEPISDVFSLGIIGHILATGRSPFPGKEYNEVLTENRQCNFNFELEIYKTVEPSLLDLIIKMMEVDPKKRIRSDELLEHPFFKTDFKEVALASDAEESGMVALAKDSKNKKDFTKIQDSIGSFVVGRPNMLRGRDSVYVGMSQNSTDSVQTVPSSPQSIKQSKFVGGKRERQPQVQSTFKAQYKNSQPRKKHHFTKKIVLDELKDS